MFFFSFGFVSFSLLFCSASKSNHQNCNNETKQQLKRKHKLHLNSLWSVWYGILATYLQGYLALHGAYRFLGKYFTQNSQREYRKNLNLMDTSHKNNMLQRIYF